MKTEVAIVLILVVSAIITAVMVESEMNSIGYLFTGNISVLAFLPLVFGIIMSVVVAALKKNDTHKNS